MKKIKSLNDMPNLEDIGSGAVLNLKKVKKQAETLLSPCRKLEDKKKIEGYVWMVKDKTSKLVHPDNIKANLDAGFHLTKKIKK